MLARVSLCEEVQNLGAGLAYPATGQPIGARLPEPVFTCRLPANHRCPSMPSPKSHTLVGTFKRALDYSVYFCEYLGYFK